MTTLHVYQADHMRQGSDEWLELRRGLITASTVGQLITPSTIKPARNDKSRALIFQLLAERITGVVEETYQSAAMLRGVMDEPIARNLYSERLAPVTECAFMRREAGPWQLGYSPDGLVGDDGLIEIKSREPKHHVKTILDDAVPVEHIAQLQAGLLVSGREWIDYVSYCGGMPLYVKRVFPDERWQDAIETAVRSAEETIRTLLETYEDHTRNLPVTERIDHFPEIY